MSDNTPESPLPAPRNSYRGVWIVLVAIFAGLPILLITWAFIVDALEVQGYDSMNLVLMPMILWGLTLWLITGPLFVWYKYKGQTQVAQQILIGSGIAALLNVGCYGLMMGM